MLSSISNKGFAQTMEADLEATVLSVNPDKTTGLMYSSKLGSVIEFVNETLAEVLPGDKVLIISPPSPAERKTGITFKAKEGATQN